MCVWRRAAVSQSWKASWGAALGRSSSVRHIFWELFQLFRVYFKHCSDCWDIPTCHSWTSHESRDRKTQSHKLFLLFHCLISLYIPFKEQFNQKWTISDDLPLHPSPFFVNKLKKMIPCHWSCCMHKISQIKFLFMLRLYSKKRYLHASQLYSCIMYMCIWYCTCMSIMLFPSLGKYWRCWIFSLEILHCNMMICKI